MASNLKATSNTLKAASTTRSQSPAPAPAPVVMSTRNAAGRVTNEEDIAPVRGLKAAPAVAPAMKQGPNENPVMPFGCTIAQSEWAELSTNLVGTLKADGTLILAINTNCLQKESASGKSEIIATTGGVMALINGIQVSLNIFKYINRR